LVLQKGKNVIENNNLHYVIKDPLSKKEVDKDNMQINFTSKIYSEPGRINAIDTFLLKKHVSCYS
jgi:uncharacterized protein Yka (UPF0111/DUF47 family)